MSRSARHPRSHVDDGRHHLLRAQWPNPHLDRRFLARPRHRYQIPSSLHPPVDMSTQRALARTRGKSRSIGKVLRTIDRCFLF